MTPQKTVVAGYARVSSIAQGKGESLQEQEKAIREYAEKEGWKIHQVYIDRETGIRDDRTNFQKMKEEARARKFSKILFCKLDRFGRSASDNLVNFDFYSELEVDLICLDQNIPKTPEGALLRGVLSLLAEYEHNLIKSRTQGGRLAKVAKKEIIIGTMPYGYRWNQEERKIEIVEEEKGNYLGMVKGILDGSSPGSIANKLNDAGKKTRKGNPWDADAVRLILQNRTHYGDYVTHQYRHVMLKTKGKKIQKESRPPSEWVHYPAPPMIEKGTWARVQKILDSRSYLRKRRIAPENDPFFLRGLLECGHCGSKVHVAYTKGKDKIFRYYQCVWSQKKTPPRRPKRIKERCPLPLIDAQKLEDMVFREIVQFFMFPEQIARHWQAEMESSPVKSLGEQLKKKGEQIGREQKKLERWLDLYGDGTYSKETLDRKYQEVNALLARLNEEKSDLENRIRASVGRKEDLAKFRASVKDFRAMGKDLYRLIMGMPPHEKRDFLIHVFSGRRIPVRILTLGDISEPDHGQPKALLGEPVIEKVYGRDKAQVIVDTSWRLGDFLEGLDFLKGKRGFYSTTKWLGSGLRQKTPRESRG
jgi:site-specific DNA recombinase